MKSPSGNFHAPPLIHEMVSFLPANALVLDAGAAAGSNGNFIAQYGHKVVSLDVNLESLQIGHRQLQELGNLCVNNFVCGNMQQLPFRKETFDAVLSHISLQDIIPKSNAIKTLINLMAITKNGGINVVQAYIGTSSMRLAKQNSYSVFAPTEVEELYRNSGWQVNTKQVGALLPYQDGPITSTTQIIAHKP